MVLLLLLLDFVMVLFCPISKALVNIHGFQSQIYDDASHPDLVLTFDFCVLYSTLLLLRSSLERR